MRFHNDIWSEKKQTKEQVNCFYAGSLCDERYLSILIGWFDDTKRTALTPASHCVSA